MEIIMRMISGLITVTATLVLVRYIYGLVIVFENKAKTFKFNISNIIAFLIGMIANLSVIYGLIWIIKFFAIRVQSGIINYNKKVFKEDKEWVIF